MISFKKFLKNDNFNYITLQKFQKKKIKNSKKKIKNK